MCQAKRTYAEPNTCTLPRKSNTGVDWCLWMNFAILWCWTLKNTHWDKFVVRAKCCTSTITYITINIIHYSYVYMYVIWECVLFIKYVREGWTEQILMFIRIHYIDISIVWYIYVLCVLKWNCEFVYLICLHHKKAILVENASAISMEGGMYVRYIWLLFMSLHVGLKQRIVWFLFDVRCLYI